MLVGIPHDADRKEDLYSVSTSMQGKGFWVYADAPFGVHENPGIQSVAVSGHVPAKSLESR